MSLVELVDNTTTDKNTNHSYLNLYQDLLFSKKKTAKNVLEIGVQNRGSVKLWHDFFTNATVYGVDIITPLEEIGNIIKNKERIILYTEKDAYNETFFIG